ncbi:hypothetical protein [Pseudalkalibacillus decolorationis]|uniref:hypothetical protein n=1 Tax=Pseudalkalibacillus decolorationis TaxID=163879 RepID=UPI002148F22C|nr:hypothetical protein [Pseudalkalibacillus decolorationis]
MKEPMYDDDTIKLGDEMDHAQLIVDLLIYSKKLEEMIIELRKEVNELTPEGQTIPYAELHSDIYENFDDYQAYEKHRSFIELFFKY